MKTAQQLEYSDEFMELSGALLSYAGFARMSISRPDDESLISLKRNAFSLYTHLLDTHGTKISNSETIEINKLSEVVLTW